MKDLSVRINILLLCIHRFACRHYCFVAYQWQCLLTLRSIKLLDWFVWIDLWILNSIGVKIWHGSLQNCIVPSRLSTLESLLFNSHKEVPRYSIYWLFGLKHLIDIFDIFFFEYSLFWLVVIFRWWHGC